MKGKILLSLVIALGLFNFISPAWAQFNISGWWSGKGTHEQGDFVTGDWTSLQARGKKVSYLYIFQENSNSGTGYLALWDDLSQTYLLEIYTVYIKNNVAVLYIPTGYDQDGNPAAATIVLRPFGSASTVTSMRGYYTLYDLESTVTPDQFVRMGPILLNRVLVSRVPPEVKLLIP
ncbi:MAG: hypothetical protein A2156_03375 [Deltaproteobacteria bacterium RBG_16_48_10]|nr:MAG: hypothetical protein A2156_03375 [Deltaproteobacteria bacterium RBG_16_48_10]